MFWQEEVSADQFQVSDDVTDLVFDINCRALPVDHAHALAVALIEAIPWIAGDARIGIHYIHVAGSQNGWQRPEHNTNNCLVLSHRAKLVIRVPRDCIIALEQQLSGTVLNIAGYNMQVGQAKLRPLSKHTTLFARYVMLSALTDGVWGVPTSPVDEEAFLNWTNEELITLGVRMRKAVCGKMLMITTPSGPLPTRSLLLADLSLAESITLQQQGIGTHHLLGCGIFIPHKGIGPVYGNVGE